jgi:hypothetical protein
VGIPAKALIFKALDSASATYQQSYPQKLWVRNKAFVNQSLSAYSAETP